MRVVRRVVAFEVSQYRSLLRWVTRRPDVPPGAEPFPYVGAVSTVLWAFVALSAVELVALHLILPWETVRAVADVLGVWGLVFALGFAASLTVHPHLVTSTALRVRSGSRVDVTIPWSAVAAVTVRERSRDSSRAVQLDRDGDRVVAHVPSGSRTNVDVRLREPLPVALPGGEEHIAELRLFADDARGLARTARQRAAAG